MNRNIIIAIVLVPTATALVAGCNRNERSDTTGKSATTQPQREPTGAEKSRLKSMLDEETQPQTPALPPGHPPLGAQSPQQPAGPAAPAALVYDVPGDWQRVQPASRMRLDQLEIPPAGGDEEGGELAVFHFGPQAGSIDQNIARWRSQFTTAEGEPLPDEAVHTEQIESDGLPTVVVDMAGQYSTGMMGGDQEKKHRRMLAAIVATPNGPWFFKAVGPDATMTAHRAAFMDLLASVRRPDKENGE